MCGEHMFVYSSPARTAVAAEIWARKQARAYAYLLGVYLGDGHITRNRRNVYCLWIHMDARYPRVIKEVVQAVSAVMPTNKVSAKPHYRSKSVLIRCYSNRWPLTINPRELIRGLIHSDGSRYVARQRVAGRTYRYDRYCFSNRSRDIMRIFCNHLELLGIHWTQAGPEQAQIARREAVEALDQFVGLKR
jgi:hypothetical protein